MQSGGGQNIRPREDRRRTILPARIRNGAGWVDASILNISSRGLLIHSKCAAQPGSLIKLWRGANLVVARVVWRSNERIGVCTPEPIAVDELISSQAASVGVPELIRDGKIERQTRPRNPDRSRERSRAAEFVSLALVGTVLAAAAAVYAYEALAGPLEAVRRALGTS